MATRFFTLFDRNYAARGLSMLDSLNRVSETKQKTTVLALDEDAWRVAQGHASEVLRIEDLGDAEFLALKSTRPHREFCWTCAPVLSKFMLDRAAPGDLVAYLDADLYFFSDPTVLLTEMGNTLNIMIHPHRFSPDRAPWEEGSGTFNVGFVAFRAGEEAGRCAARWRQQVLDVCVLDPDKGLCGDQGYLNEWPSLYSGLQIMQNIGGGTAPWNLASYKVAGTPIRPTVNGQPIVFFHFHQLKVIDCRQDRFLGAVCAAGYEFPPEVGQLIYRGYLQKLKRLALRLQGLGIPLTSDAMYDAREFRCCVRAGALVVQESLWTRIRYFLIVCGDNGARLRRRYLLYLGQLKRLIGMA